MRPTPHRPLSNETINKLLVRLGQVLDAAEERELIARNPMRVNTRNRKLKVSRPQRSYLDSARQITTLFDAAADLDAAARSDHRHLARRAMLAALVFAGMRLGELLSLRWRCVDLADGWLYIGRSKTDAGVRRIKIRPALRDVLLEHKANPDTSTDPRRAGVRHCDRPAALTEQRAPDDAERGRAGQRAATGGRGGAAAATHRPTPCAAPSRR